MFRELKLVFRSCYIIILLITSSQYAYSKKVRSIKKIDIHHLEFTYDTSSLRIPGNTVKYGIQAIAMDGEVYTTKGFLDGSLRWCNFKVNTNAKTLIPGYFRIPETNKALRNEKIEITIMLRQNPGVKLKHEIPYNYEVGLKFNAREGFIKAPGRTIDFNLLTTFDNGQVRTINRKSKDYNSLDNYGFNVYGADLYRGRIVINNDIFSIVDHKVYVGVYLKNDRSVYDEFEVILDYRDHFYNSAAGFSGYDGFSGSDGCNGGTGSAGCNGTDGSNGNDGERGPDMDVFVDVYYDQIVESNLLKVWVENLSSEQYYAYLVNTSGGSISIYSRGGDGGDGGAGGDGGDGGDGYDGECYTIQKKVNDSTYVEETKCNPGGPGGNGGNGGDGGYGGHGGNGGNIRVFYTDKAKYYLDLIEVCSIPGSGGSGGWSGSGGSGGSGGDGDPDGSSGNSGSSGSSGFSGSSGYSGRVDYILMDEFVFW